MRCGTRAFLFHGDPGDWNLVGSCVACGFQLHSPRHKVELLPGEVVQARVPSTWKVLEAVRRSRRKLDQADGSSGYRYSHRAGVMVPIPPPAEHVAPCKHPAHRWRVACPADVPRGRLPARCGHCGARRTYSRSLVTLT